MTETPELRVLVIEDNPQTAGQICRYLNDRECCGFQIKLEVFTDFPDGLSRLESGRFDLVILDVLKGGADSNNEAGRRTFEAIKERRFLPVIFYTALEDRVEDLKSAVVKVVPKGQGVSALEGSLREQVGNGLPRVNRELNSHFENAIREYLWDFVPQHWDELTGAPEWESTLAYLLSRRIASSLDIEGADRLAKSLGSTTSSSDEAEETVHPLRFYVIPPAADGYRTGDILFESENSCYWMLLTPSCDLVPRRNRSPWAEYVLIARCVGLDEFNEYTNWGGGDPPSNLTRLLATPAGRPANRQEGRYFFLPGVLDLPDMLIDFQQVRSIGFSDLSSYEKIATLDSPFAESASSGYLQFLGRVGTPDLDTYRVIARLRANREDSSIDGEST